jgi:hypothetical protein
MRPFEGNDVPVSSIVTTRSSPTISSSTIEPLKPADGVKPCG